MADAMHKPISNFRRTKVYKSQKDKRGWHVMVNANKCCDEGHPEDAMIGYFDLTIDNCIWLMSKKVEKEVTGIAVFGNVIDLLMA